MLFSQRLISVIPGFRIWATQLSRLLYQVTFNMLGCTASSKLSMCVCVRFWLITHTCSGSKHQNMCGYTRRLHYMHTNGRMKLSVDSLHHPYFLFFYYYFFFYLFLDLFISASLCLSPGLFSTLFCRLLLLFLFSLSLSYTHWCI